MTPQRFALVLLLFINFSAMAQYNTLWIPPTLTGPNFALTLHDTTKQLRAGQITATSAVNANDFWGPTLIMNTGDNVSLAVHNTLADSTTIHWHGMHLPAMMDGGPHQPIAPATTWTPYWTVDNPASTLWYHPHLHEKTKEQIVQGIGGFIIIRDPIESALALPRTYGIDDIPLALTSRRYTPTNQFSFNGEYGDYLLVNGTSNAEINLPQQYVRFRILDAEVQRGFNLGFSDNRTFYVIATEGALVNAPIPVTRLVMVPGERYEIAVNLGNDAIGSSVDLKAYNAGQPFGFPGGEPAATGQFGSLLNNIDFTVLHINVTNPTASPITSLPTTLANNTYWTAADATVNRTVTVTGGGPMGGPFTFDNAIFDMEDINHTVDLNAIERWTLVNNNVFSHSFHIHDIQFKIVSRSSGAIPAYEQGWKDVIYLQRNETVSFVAKFDDFADPTHPYMYHCHFAGHEDAGMMGQFVVVCPTSVTPTITGNNSVCADNSLIYTYSTSASGSAYNWSIMDGTLLSGQGTNTITVEWTGGTTGMVMLEVTP